MASAPGSDEAPLQEHFSRCSGPVWRLVESQNVISSDRLVEDPDDQPLLEDLIEEVKPPIPDEAKHLPKLLASPFRYWHQASTRFRRANEKPGILYTSETEATSVAEMAYYRLLFLSRAPEADAPRNITEHTSFTLRADAARTIDLMAMPFVLRRAEWTNPNDYTACQDFAAAARQMDTQAIRYESVRQSEGQANVAILDPEAVDGDSLQIVRSWHFRFEGGRLSAFAAYPSPQHLTFTFEQFGLAAA